MARADHLQQHIIHEEVQHDEFKRNLETQAKNLRIGQDVSTPTACDIALAKARIETEQILLVNLLRI
jgi:hypothetical protein